MHFPGICSLESVKEAQISGLFELECETQDFRDGRAHSLDDASFRELSLLTSRTSCLLSLDKNLHAA
jgi:hypothetical protein